ncbi:hypothetical protein ABB37_09482 [Leptomonas pyrrhocoris]|uniref:Uncharacterized protein n=1 Tax=Leptomonas pyrrhocoris TaxID=157538 RepID=A0A0N0DQW0_LEPPY|nr:hypothetical protein ABB37_09482 [Leptomonas pyrrhocoris]KPA73842.1 hypothetical protein ABB37_09482 [Leptomonas pyrrhocoris]|eukprot:XP_015652281.1 hypothetical protein ABB37_09482 [Leptomonas pyrrhocoris]
MEFVNDPFVLHAIALILTPVSVLVFVLLWINTREVRRFMANAPLQQPQPPPPVQRSCRKPTYIDLFTANSPYSMSASAAADARRTPLFTADDSSTYSCFGDSLVPRPWLLTPEDAPALDIALNCG